MAQVETGQISGAIVDTSGAVVSGASITVKNLRTNAQRTATSSDTGTFKVVGLEPAIYQVTVTSGSFKPYNAKAEVTVGGHVTLNVKLSINAVTAVVQVIAEGGTQINTENPELSQIINATQVAQLPSLSRDPYDFVMISGNISNGDSGASGSATGSSSNSQNTYNRGVGFNINGQRSSGTEILLDGVENVGVFSDGIGIFIPLDAMQEFRVSTSNFEPQFGRASGGVVNVITKSGSNAFHGSAWEFNRLSAYTANTYTNAVAGAPKGTYTRNQFGFSVGGPALKNKLFLFGSSEWTRVRSSAVLIAGVPDPDFLNSSSGVAANIRSYFANFGSHPAFNVLNTYTADDVYVTGLGGTLPAGLSGTTNTLDAISFTGPQNAGGGYPQNTYNYLIRGDFNPNDKTQSFFRFVNYKEVDETGSSFVSPYSQYNVGQTYNNQAYLLNVSHLFTPSLSTNTKLSFSRFNTVQSYDTTLQNTPTLVVTGGATIPGTTYQMQLPGFYDTNPANGGLPYGGPQNTSQINQDVSWLKGKHSLQSGVQLMYIQENQAYGAYAQAEEQLGKHQADGFPALYTGNLYLFELAVNPNGAFPCVRNPYTGVLTQTAGCSITLPVSSPSFARSYRYKDWAYYAQDSWKATSKLTANYGVRYEYYGIQHNDNPNLDSNYYYGAGSSIAEQERSGNVYTVPNSPIHKLWNPQYGTISPRVGFAYDIFGNGRDSIRGGYGIAYERNFGNVTFNVIQNPPNYAVVIVNNTTVYDNNAGPLGPPATGSVALPPTSVRHVDQNIRTAQTQFWSLAVEHELKKNAVVSVQYVGARGTHLYDVKNYNGLGGGNAMLGDPNIDPVTHNYGLTRLNSQYSDANNRGSNGDSYYEGVNIQFQANNLYQTGLSLVANYTFSHQMDDLSTTFSDNSSGYFNLGYTNPFNPRLDRGDGDLDVRQRLVLSPIYAEPFYKNSHDWRGEVLGGWQISGIFQAHTGAPFSFFDSTSNYSGYNVPRYTPAGTLTQHTFKSIPSGVSGGSANSFNLGTLPAANSWGNPNLQVPDSSNPQNPDLTDYPNGISDWGPWPSTMTGRNSFRGPGIWGLDVAMSKTFPIRGNINVEFRAEGFNILNHHNLFLQESSYDAASSLDVTASKGGIGNNGGANDERRFGQFALKLNF
jgi:hypothetical protein